MSIAGIGYWKVHSFFVSINSPKNLKNSRIYEGYISAAKRIVLCDFVAHKIFRFQEEIHQ
jgi:hypothetical protein